MNSFYNTDNHESNIFTDQKYEYPVIENRIVEGYSLFDWCKVLENAKEARRKKKQERRSRKKKEEGGKKKEERNFFLLSSFFAFRVPRS